MRIRCRHLQGFPVDFHLAAGEDGTRFVCGAGEYRFLDDVFEHVILDFEVNAVREPFHCRKILGGHGEECEVGGARLDLADILVNCLGKRDGISGKATDDFLQIASGEDELSFLFDFRRDDADDAHLVVCGVKFHLIVSCLDVYA